MPITSVADLVVATAERDRAQGEVVELESAYMPEAKVTGKVWAKAGSMVAYRGGLKFKRQDLLSQGVGTLLKKLVSGEGASLMAVEGNGRACFAGRGKKMTPLRLAGESIVVNGNDVLAFEDGITSDITMMRRVAGMPAGGLFNIRLSGSGVVAIASHYDPMTLAVKPGEALHIDPNATVAWSGNLEPDFATDIQLGTGFGRGSGESVQMKFEGRPGWWCSPTTRSPGSRRRAERC